MRTEQLTLAFMISMFVASGCEPGPYDELATGEATITAAECEGIDWPHSCPAYDEMSNSTLAPKCDDHNWMVDDQGRNQWKPGRPICFGFGGDIKECKNCNKLQMKDSDYTMCKNQLFLECAKRGYLPGQLPPGAEPGDKNPPCPVTPPDDVTWPEPGKGSDDPPGPTTAEYCDLGPPTAEQVAECRRKAECDPES
ncbi:MAG TPA: hypothetical protein VIV11_22145 [Kofleriaceae bacterium]